jgi:hypothetical protein
MRAHTRVRPYVARSHGGGLWVKLIKELVEGLGRLFKAAHGRGQLIGQRLRLGGILV